MPSIDMPLEKLREYQPPLYREADFDDYWRGTIAAAIRQPLNAELIPYEFPTRGVQCYAVRFDGFEGGRLAGWYLRPETGGKLPGVCYYHGYSGRGWRPKRRPTLRERVVNRLRDFRRVSMRRDVHVHHVRALTQ